jgi:large repetitive protein
MATPRNRRVRFLSQVAGIGAVLALVATALLAGPAVSAGNGAGSGKATVTNVTATPAIAGQPLAFTATVTHGHGVPTGSVTFSIRGSDGSVPQCSGGSNTIGLSPAGRGSQAQCTLVASASAAASPYQVSAAYSGDAAYAQSLGTLSKNVHAVKTATSTTSTPGSSNPKTTGKGSEAGKAKSSGVQNTKSAATVTLSSSRPIALVSGAPVTFTATVNTGGAPATGRILFTVVGAEGSTATCDGGALQPLTTSGGITTAACSFAKGLPGKPLYYTVTAKLVDPNYTGMATLTQQIGKSLTRTSVKRLPGSLVAGQAFTFTAVVQDVAPGTGSPTGSMEFAVCPYFAPTCTGFPSGVFDMRPPNKWEQAHNQNRIRFTIPSGVLTPGFYDVSADYVGDSNYWSSQSAFSFLLVTPVPTTMRLVLSDNPTYDGGREILRASVHSDSRATMSLPGPSGTVTFNIRGRSGDTLVCQETGSNVIPIGTKTANQGLARCDISGEIHSSDSPYIVSTVYSGDSIYNGSSHFPLLLHVVNQP